MGPFGVCWGSVGGTNGICYWGSVRSLLVTKFGELICTALQIEAWCHYPINFLETVMGFDVYMSVREKTLNVSEDSLGV